MSVDLPSEQAAVLAALLKAVGADKSEVYSYKPPASNAKQYVAVLRPLIEPGLAVVTTLGSLSKRIYLAVTDAEPDVLTEVVARSEFHDAAGHGLLLGHTLRFEGSDFLQRTPWVGVFLGVPQMLEITANVPKRIDLPGDVFEPLLCILLTAEEMRIWKSGGATALLDHFEDTERNLVQFERSASA